MATRTVRNNAGTIVNAKAVPFTYVLPLNVAGASVAAGTSLSGTIKLDPGMPFFATGFQLASSADTGTIGALDANWNASVLDNSTRQQFQSGDVPREAFFGTREFPRTFGEEILLDPASELAFTLTRVVDASTATLYVMLHGYKLQQISNPN